jgi:hypothetical protein
MNFTNEGKRVIFKCDSAQKVWNDLKYLHFSFPCWLTEITDENLQQMPKESPNFIEKKIQEDASSNSRKEHRVEVIPDNSSTDVIQPTPSIVPESIDSPDNAHFDFPSTKPAESLTIAQENSKQEKEGEISSDKVEKDLETSQPIPQKDYAQSEDEKIHPQISKELDIVKVEVNEDQSDDNYSYDPEETNSSSNSPYQQQIKEREKLWRKRAEERDKKWQIDLLKKMYEEYKQRAGQASYKNGN